LLPRSYVKDASVTLLEKFAFAFNWPNSRQNRCSKHFLPRKQEKGAGLSHGSSHLNGFSFFGVRYMGF